MHTGFLLYGFFVLFPIVLVFVFWYRRGHSVPRWMFRFRVTLGLYLPLAYHNLILADLSVGGQWVLKGRPDSALNATVSALMVLIAFMAESWLSPLLVSQPIMGRSSVPSGIVPSMESLRWSDAYAALFSVTMCVETRPTDWLFTCGSVVLGVFLLYWRWVHPFCDALDTAMHIALAACYVVNPIVSRVMIGRPYDEEITLGVGAFVAVAVTVVSVIRITARDRRLLSEGKRGNVDEQLARVLILNRTVDAEFFFALRDRPWTSVSEIILIAYVGALAPNCRGINLSAAAEIGDCNWLEQYALYQLRQDRALRHSVGEGFATFGDLPRLAHAYREKAVTFWDEMVNSKWSRGLRVCEVAAASRREVVKELRSVWMGDPIQAMNDPGVDELVRECLRAEHPERVSRAALTSRLLTFIGWSIVEEAEEPQGASGVDSQVKRIRANIARFARRDLSVPVVVITFLAWILAVGAMTASYWPFASYPVSVSVDVPDIVVLSTDITWSLVRINVALALLQDCDSTLLGVECHTPACAAAQRLAGEIEEQAIAVRDGLVDMSARMIDWPDATLNDEVLTLMRNRRIPLIDSKFVGARDSTLGLCEEVLSFSRREKWTCANQYINDTRGDETFPTRLQITLTSSAGMGSMLGNFVRHRTETVAPDRGAAIIGRTLMIVFGALSVVAFLLRAAFLVRDERKMLKECFQVQVNPLSGRTMAQDAGRSRWLTIALLWRLGGHAVFMTLAILSICLLRGAMTASVTRAEAVCDALIAMGNASAYAGAAAMQLARGRGTIVPLRDILSAGYAAVNASSPLNIGVGHGRFSCDGIGLTVGDVSGCVPTSQRFAIWMFAFSHVHDPRDGIAHRALELHLSTLAVPELISMSIGGQDSTAISMMHDLAVQGFRHAKLIANVGIAIATVAFTFLISFEIMSIDDLRQRREELIRMFQALDPTFIAGNADLMRFVHVSTAKLKRDPEIGVFDDCGVGLLVLDDSGRILSLTRAVQTTFGYRAEQLLGQNLEVLIKRDAAAQDAKGFYQQFERLKRRVGETTFTREAVGLMSDGTVASLRARVTLSSYLNADYFLVELKSQAVFSLHDDAIHELASKYQVAINGVYPRALFPAASGPGDRIVSQRFACGILAYFMFNPNDSEAGNADIAPLFRRDFPSIVLSTTSAHACIFFVGDPTTALDGAWGMLERLGPKLSSGILLKKRNVDAVMTLPPATGFVPVTYPEAHATVPIVTVELFEITRELPELLRHLHDGLLLLSADLAGHFAGSSPDDGDFIEGVPFRVIWMALREDVQI